MIPSTFYFKKNVNIHHKKRGFFYTTLFLISFIISPSISIAADYSCDGEDVANIDGATGDADASYTTNRNNKNARYWLFTTDTDGIITITQKNNKPQSGYWNHALKIGLACDGTSIHNGSASTLDSKTFNVVSGTTYYVKVQEANSENDLNFDIDFSFKKQDLVTGDCSKPHAFEERVSYILPGDLIAIGNSNICADNDRDGTCDTDQQKRNDIGDGGNNIIHINASSSTAVATEPSSLENTTAAQLSIPDGATIKWAGLYWQGEIWDIKTSNTSRTSVNTYSGNPIAIENGADGQARKALADKIKFKMPGGNYQELTADEHYYVFLKRTTNNSKDDYSGIPRYEMHYQSFKDVTNMLAGLTDASGNYSVADIQATVGALHYPGVEAAWNLQVIYEYQGAKAKSVTINDGYVALYGTASQGDDYANDHGCPTGGVNTGVYAYSVDFDVTGFLTPKTPGFETDLSIFVTESDPDNNPSTLSRPEELSLTKKDGSIYIVDGIANGEYDAWKYEITNKDGSDNLNRTPAYIYPIGMTIKNYRLTDALDTDQSSTHITFKTDSDRLILGVVGFSTELRQPDLCYDYAYKQYDRYFTEDNNGSYEPKIIGDGLTVGEPITVELFVQNIEDSDIVAQDMTMNILEINTTQATYITGSTYVIKPDTLIPEPHTDTDSGAGHINDIIIGDIDSQDYFYVDYDLNPITSDINIPLNAQIEYTAVFPYGNAGETIEIDYSAFLNSEIPLCSDLNFQYLPTYGIFNVEDAALSGDKDNEFGLYYDLPTQTANRSGNFKVAAYDPLDIDKRNNVSTIVGIELIDAGKYHGIDASCAEPDSALSPRVWLDFWDTETSSDDTNISLIDFNYATIADAIIDGRVSDEILGQAQPISRPEELFRNVRENTAFRVIYRELGDGDLLRVIKTRQGLRLDNFNELVQDIDSCVQPVKNPRNDTITSQVPVACSNDGNNLTSKEIATCMECLYGYGLRYVCSRDNFATRPESFRMDLKDQDQNDASQRQDITINDDDSIRHQIVAGYNYTLEINATNHENDNATPGYDVSFPLDGNSSNRTFRLSWQTSTDDTKCNDIEDHNKTFSFFNGRRVDLNLSSAQVGEYDLTLTDRLWTKVDWDDTLMTHQTGTHFLSGDDCVQGSSVPPQGESSGPSLANVSGCDITSNNHTNSDTGVKYIDIPLRVHPYTFDHDSVFPAIGPYTRTSGQTFVYIDTPPTMDANDTEMSYNMNGTFFAAGYDNSMLSNFVTGCYADNLDMDLHFTYNVPQPLITPFLSYSLKDHNSSDDTVSYRPASGTNDFEVGQHTSVNSPFTIDQNATFFAKNMNGSITMDLGYNFVRAYNQPLNPRFITFHDFNLTYNVNPTAVKADLESDFQIFGNKDLDQNVTFVYGRAKPSQYFYDDVVANNIDTPNSIVVYCDQDPITCSAVYNIETVLSKTEEFDWFLSNGHVTTDGDGNITLVASTGGDVTNDNPVAINNSGGVNNPNVNVSATVATRPLDVFIDFGNDTNRWLIYNQYLDAIPSPYYRVRFIGQSDWAGAGDTGHTVGGETSIQKNRRLGW